MLRDQVMGDQGVLVVGGCCDNCVLCHVSDWTARQQRQHLARHCSHCTSGRYTRYLRYVLVAV